MRGHFLGGFSRHARCHALGRGDIAMKHRIAIPLLAIALAPSLARAEDPPPDTSSTAPHEGHASLPTDGLSLAGLAGNGFEDGVNVGFGARLGYGFNRLYLGGTFVYHLGESRDANVLGQSEDVSVNIWYFGGEVGYDVAAGPLLVRPYAGLGMGTARGCFGSACDTESRAYIAPGVAALFPLSDRLFAGGDARFVVPLDDDSDFDHFGLFATVGGYL
jgi:hypothetical protein